MLIKHEGGFTDDQRDNGNAKGDGHGNEGSTMLGVTAWNWAKYTGNPAPKDVMKALTKEDVKPLYKQNYWDVIKADHLPSGIDISCADLCVNAGPSRAAKILQKAVGASAANAVAVGVSTSLGVASAALQISGQRQQAKTQARAQAEASKVERQRYLNEVSSLRTQQGQEQIALAQKLQANKRKAMEAQATAAVSAAEAGVAGLSVDALRNDLAAREARYTTSVSTQSQLLDVRRNLALRDSGLGFTNNMPVSYTHLTLPTTPYV